MFVPHTLPEQILGVGCESIDRLATDLSPAALRSELPTAAELAHEFPLMSLVRLRIQIERALSDLAWAHGLERQRFGIRRLLGRACTRKGRATRLGG